MSGRGHGYEEYSASVLLCITFVNYLFVFFAESTDNFVSSKSALPFALKLIYSDTFGNY